MFISLGIGTGLGTNTFYITETAYGSNYIILCFVWTVYIIGIA